MKYLTKKRQEKLPTDLKILNVIYKRYYSDFKKQMKDKEQTGSERGIYVHIDIEKIAQDLNAIKHIVFSRLYDYLDKIYRHVEIHDDGTKIIRPLFYHKSLDGKIHNIHFSYMSSILAGMRDKNKKTWIPVWVSALPSFVAMGALAVAIIALILN